MNPRGFRSKPTPAHIIWTRQTGGDSRGRKRFDHAHFENWASHCGFDYERERRVDHERSDQPRQQHRVVFRWGKTDGETIRLDGEKWSMGTQQTPRTFVEIDSTGLARVRGWTFETVLDVAALRHKGPELLMTTVSGEKKRLNARTFLTDPRKQQRDGP